MLIQEEAVGKDAELCFAECKLNVTWQDGVWIKWTQKDFTQCLSATNSPFILKCGANNGARRGLLPLSSAACLLAIYCLDVVLLPSWRYVKHQFERDLHATGGITQKLNGCVPSGSQLGKIRTVLFWPAAFSMKTKQFSIHLTEDSLWSMN